MSVSNLNTPSASEKQRTAFEKWCKEDRWSCDRDSFGNYLHPASSRFAAWQAAVATLIPVLKQAKEALEIGDAAVHREYLEHGHKKSLDEYAITTLALIALREVMGNESTKEGA